MKIKQLTLLPQDLQLLTHLESVGTITAVEAATVYKIRCLTSNIARLRTHGVQISTQFKKDLTGQRYARYSYTGVSA